MSKTIEVDEDVFASLQARAEPLVDDVNSVLRRVLGLPGDRPRSAVTASAAATRSRTAHRPSPEARKTKSPKPTRKTQRAQRGTLLPESDYELPILQALKEKGGSAPASHVIERVGELLADSLTPADNEILESGLIRWKSRTQFVRLRLAQRGDMVTGSPRGVWEISPQGLKRLEESAAA